MRNALTALALIGLMSAGAEAATVSGSSGMYNQGWYGSAQSLTVTGDGHLDWIAFDFAADSSGHTFDFSISSALTGGTTLYSTSVLISGGLNTIATNLNLTVGDVVWAIFDYNGFNGQTVGFGNDAYADGNSAFFMSGWQDYPQYDLSFTADFSDSATVPVPAAGGLLLAALAGLGALRRRKSA